MKKLSDAIKKDAINEPPNKELTRTDLDIAGEAWTLHCVRTYTGELLKRGLAISEAIANFTNELIHPS